MHALIPRRTHGPAILLIPISPILAIPFPTIPWRTLGPMIPMTRTAGQWSVNNLSPTTHSINNTDSGYCWYWRAHFRGCVGRGPHIHVDGNHRVRGVAPAVCRAAPPPTHVHSAPVTLMRRSGGQVGQRAIGGGRQRPAAAEETSSACLTCDLGSAERGGAAAAAAADRTRRARA